MLSTSGRHRIGGALALTLLLGGPTAAATIVVDSTADDFDGAPNGNCTLREAIVAANTNAAVDGCPAGEPGPGVVDLVQVPAGLFVLSIGGAGENQSATGDLDLTDDVIISGAGAPLTVVDADGIDRVFDVADVQAELTGLTLRNGHAGGGNGGAIENGGELMVEFCAIESSFAGGPGGGVRNDNDVTLVSSVLSGNTSADHGAGMDDHGTSFLVNVTVSGNTVTGGGAGGGLYNLSGTEMTALHVTVADNVSGAGTALHNGGSTMLTSSLLVGTCDGDVETSGGGNLESPGSTCALVGTNDVSGVAALIGPLEDNGGPTLTHALLAASPAIDLALPGPCPAVDQRGVARPFDGDGDGRPDCDAGAFERTQPSLIFQNGFESGDTSGWSVVVD